MVRVGHSTDVDGEGELSVAVSRSRFVHFFPKRPTLRNALILAIGAWLGLCISLPNAMEESLSDRVRTAILARLTASPRPQQMLCRKEVLCGPSVLLRFYARRDFRPAWNVDSRPRPEADELVQAIRSAGREGLRPGHYHLDTMEALLAEAREFTIAGESIEPELLADLDLLLTDAFLLYGSHLLTGHVNPETVQSEWVIKSREEALDETLLSALKANGVQKALESLRPQHAGYANLRQALAHYENNVRNGGWTVVPEGPKMVRGDQSPRVRLLRSRLIASGDLDATEESDQNSFDEVLEKAVRRFQVRHGLDVDGVVGRATLRALNVPAEQRVDQVRFNMERWRWLPQDLGRRFILVNLANFELDVVEHGCTVMTMRVVVGRRYRRTPVFTGTMTYMELNPYWHVPPNIAVQDILPNIQKDADYLIKKQMRVFQSWQEGAPEIKPESIDWSRVTVRDFLFKLRQDPGPSNALGRVKFMFPNKFNVYLHDTPARALFQKTQRTFSSGCIRLERPIDLAAYLLQGDAEWTHETIMAAINGGETQIVRVPDPIPVHLLYWTAWVDSAGTLHFRDDIYGRDERLRKALSEGPPTP